MARRAQRFTIYDAMEARGEFALNPANADAQDRDGRSIYEGPVRFPKMVYHPQGAERITAPGEYLTTPLGPKLVGQQRELIWEVARNPGELKALLEAGWHLRPSEALRAAGKDAPAATPAQTIAELEQKIRDLELERNTAMTQQLEAPNSTGAALPPAQGKKPD